MYIGKLLWLFSKLRYQECTQQHILLRHEVSRCPTPSKRCTAAAISRRAGTIGSHKHPASTTYGGGRRHHHCFSRRFRRSRESRRCSRRRPRCRRCRRSRRRHHHNGTRLRCSASSRDYRAGAGTAARGREAGGRRGRRCRRSRRRHHRRSRRRRGDGGIWAGEWGDTRRLRSVDADSDWGSDAGERTGAAMRGSGLGQRWTGAAARGVKGGRRTGTAVRG